MYKKEIKHYKNYLEYSKLIICKITMKQDKTRFIRDKIGRIVIINMYNTQSILPQRWRCGSERSPRRRNVGCSTPQPIGIFHTEFK